MNEPLKVLIVEDSEDDAKLALRALRRGGFDPTYRRVQTAAELKTALAQEHWDAVISDFNMPGFTGLDALRIFRSTGLDIPFILISGTIGEETAVDAMKAGASDYVMKKSLARLAPALERDLNETQMRAAHRLAQRKLVASEQRLRTIIETEPECVKVMSKEGVLLEMNAAGLAMLEADSLAAAQSQPPLEFIVPEYRAAFAALHKRVMRGEKGILEYEVIGLKGGRRWLETHAAPMSGANGEGTMLLGVTRDITERKNSQDRIVYLNRVYAMLSGINALLIHARDRDELYREACRIAVDAGGFRMAWVAMVDRKVMKVAPVASAGVDEELLSALNQRFLLAQDGSLGNTRAARAISDKKVIVTNDLKNNTSVAFGQKYAERGIGSMAMLPLIVADEAVGALALYARENAFFHEEELKLLTELTGDITFAIEHIEKEEKIARLSRIQALMSGINAVIVHVRDHQELFNEACRIAAEHGQFEIAWIGKLDPATQDVTPVAWAGESAEELTRSKSSAQADNPRGQGAVGRAIRERRPVFNNDIAAHSFGGPRMKEILRLGFRSQITLPLFEDQTVVATLTMYAREPNFFDEEERGLLTELAGNLSFALAHISKEEKVARLSRIQAVMSGINTVIVHVRDRQQLLNEACRIAVEHGGFGMAWIGTVNPDNLEITPAASAGIESDSLLQYKSTAQPDSPLGQGELGRAVREQRAVFSNDITVDSGVGGERRKEAIRRGYRSSISLPLLVEGAVVGNLSLFAGERNFFNTGELKLLTDLAGNISFALEHIARQDKVEKLSRIRSVSSEINSLIVRIRDRQKLLAEACRIAVEHGGFGIAWIGMLDPKTLEIIPAASAGVDADSLSATSRNTVFPATSMVGRAISERRPVFSNELALETSEGRARRQEAQRCGYRSLIVLPLVVENKAVGNLSLFTKEPNFFDDEEIMLLTELAGNVSFALELIQKGAALADSEKKLDSILSTLHEVVWSMDPESGRIVYVNAAVEHLTRQAPADFLAQRRLWRRMVHRDDRESMRNSIRRLLQEGTLAHEFRIVLADGEARTVECGARVRRDATGKSVSIDGTLSDITERVRAEERQRRQYALACLLAALAAAANEAVTVEAAFQNSLKLISDYGGWLIAHLATFAADHAQRGVVSSLWQVEDRDRLRFANLIEYSEHFDNAKFGRFMARVIGTKLPIWIEDTSAIPPSQRTGLALAAGLRRAFAFPVVVQNEVAAVLEFYAEDARPADTLLIENINQVAAQLARVIERARAGESQTRLAAIVASSQDGIVSSTPDGTILTWNAGAEKMFGYASKEIIGHKITLLVPDDLRQDVQQRRQRYLSSGNFVPYESERLTKDRRRLAVSVNASPLKDGTNQIIGIATIYRDITERKQAETALLRLNDELEDKVVARTVDLQRARHEAEEASHAKSSFLAAMSHEIRTPMNGVIGMIDVLHQSSLKGDQVEMVELIRESAFSLLGIIEDILDFSKIEAGKLDLEQAPIAVADVVEGVCSLLNSMADKKDVALTLYTDPAIPAQVLGDALRLRQVLINLVNNAIKFCSGQPRAGRVSVRALLIERSAEKVTVELRVTDNGIGMDEETQARLFSAFAQADASTTRRFGGTGLGLVIANHLVELMGGEITVQSAPGAGATFKVRLPFVPLPIGSSAAEAASASDVAGLSCVVVGTAGGLADDLATYLEHANALVERAPDLAGAKAHTANRSGLSVWIVDDSGEPQLLEQLRVVARAKTNQGMRIAVVLIERGKRRRPRAVASDLITVDGNALSRRTFLKAVAVAAGRASLETEMEKPTSGRLTAIAPSRAEALRQGKLILIAEDNETNQKVIVRQLALLGYTADVAADGREALNRWRSGEYSLLLTDLHMPEMDGYELAQAIRAEEKSGKHMPIIALTANALKGEAEHCRAVGMDDYRSKPSPLAELKAVLNQWLPVARSEADASALSGLPAAAAPQAATAVPVDVSILEGLVGDDPALVHEFLQDFRASAAKIALELRAACVAGQAKAAAAAAHKLKSSALAVGALALGELCAAMENTGPAGDGEALSVLLQRFETEMAVVEDYLDRRIVNAPSSVI